METVAIGPVDGGGVIPSLQRAREKLEGSGGELVLDFSSVHRLDAIALKAMEDFAAMAGEKQVKVVLRGVNIEVYKVLKLVKLAPRFSFPA